MEEVVASEDEFQKDIPRKTKTDDEGDDDDNFLDNKDAIRVLLVEADDSSRQIITALLKKCSYKVIGAVGDGLKAWEVLKSRSQCIDLILTEVELPSISGYALLTLIMHHQICRDIPVIMMSSIDSVGTVYKCMLRGATDFLMKPVKKDEVTNLWQHVRRKQVIADTGAAEHDIKEAEKSCNRTRVNYNDNEAEAGGCRSRIPSPRMDGGEGIDLNIGAFDTLPVLDLSLNGSSVIQSDASAVPWYIDKQLQMPKEQLVPQPRFVNASMSRGEADHAPSYVSSHHLYHADHAPHTFHNLCNQATISNTIDWQHGLNLDEQWHRYGTSASVVRGMAEFDYGEGSRPSQLSMQREAALAKFRSKRKDRCFEKKVCRFDMRAGKNLLSSARV